MNITYKPTFVCLDLPYSMSPSKNNNNNNNVYARPVPQTSMGRLVSITVDNPKYHTAPVSNSSHNPIPHLIPISAAETKAEVTDSAHNDEQTMLWRNIATLFAKCEQNEAEIQKQREDYDPCIGTLNRATDDLYQETYQETRDLKHRISELSTEMSDELESKLRQMKKQTRKYVSKKVNKSKQSASGSAFDADMEVFEYVDTVRDEFTDTNSKLKQDIAELNDTYYRDYLMFLEREDDLMAKLGAAVKMNEDTNQHMKDMEEYFMKQIQQARNYTDSLIAGDLREEFSAAICREVAFESKVSAQLVQGVHDELTDLITRSNEYHSQRYFGTVEDVKQIRETCQTLKQSIGMVDAELSDTKEIVEYLKDEVGDVANTVSDLTEKVDEVTDTVCDLTDDLIEQKDTIYHEMDCDYDDMKEYVKRRIQRHVRHSHPSPSADVAIDAMETESIAMIVSEYSQDATATTEAPVVPVPVPVPVPAPTEDDENVIVMDDTCMISDEE